MMHEQHRYGTPSRPRANDHTRWARPDGEPHPLIRIALLSVILVTATLLLVMVSP